MANIHHSRHSSGDPQQAPVRSGTKKNQRPIHIRMGSCPSIIIVPYGLFMGIGFAALVFVSLAFGTPSHNDARSLSYALYLTLSSAILFARLLSIVMEDGAASIMTQPVRTILRPGFWLHGGLFGATAGAFLAWKLNYVKNFPMFAGSLAMGLPLYETFSRIGCHTYGCCYGRMVESLDQHTRTLVPYAPPSQFIWRLFPFPAVRYNHPTHYAATRLNPTLLHRPLFPIQLISASLFLLIFVIISLPVAYITTVELAGSTTLICHAAVRLITEMYRADYRGSENGGWLSMTGKMALIQAAIAIVWLWTSLNCRSLAVVTQPVLYADEDLEQMKPLRMLERVQERIQMSLYAIALGIVVYGVHIGEVGSWVPVRDRKQI